MKTLIRFSTVKIRFLFHPFTSRKSLYVWHKYGIYIEDYTAVRRYEFYLRVVKTIFYERVQRVSKILFSPPEDKIHIFKPPCNVLGPVV